MNLLLNGPKGSFVIVDYVILVLAVISNCVVLQGIIKAKFNLAGYRRFLISLVISELYVCAVNLALFMFEILTWYMPNSFGNHCESHVLRSFQLVGFFANLLNLLGMTVDHFIGIIYPLKYRSWMRTSVARTAVWVIWVTSVIFGFADMPVATVKYVSQKSSANSKPAVCSGNVISDIVDILESSDFLTANSQLLFNNNEMKTGANAGSSLANGFGLNRMKNGTGNGTIPGDYAGYSNYYANNPAMTDPALYPFLFLAQSESYYDDKVLRDTRSVKSKIRKNRTRSSGFKWPQSAPLILNNTARAATAVAMTTTPHKLSTFSFQFQPDTTRLPDFYFNITIGGSSETTTVESSMATLARRIIQSPENEVALCEALIKAQTKMDDHGWCSQYGSDPWLEVCIMSLTVVCFIFFTFSYGKIFRKVFVEAEFKRRKTRKMVVTTCLLLSIFALCYLPFMLYEFFMMWYDDAAQVQSSTTRSSRLQADQDNSFSYDMFLLIHNVFNSLLLSYPLFDPIIFVARSPPVMRNVIEQFSCLLPCCPSIIQARINMLTSVSKYSTSGEAVTRSGPGRSSYRLSSRNSNSAGPGCYSEEAAKTVEIETSYCSKKIDNNNNNNNNNNQQSASSKPLLSTSASPSYLTEISPNGLASSNNSGNNNNNNNDNNNGGYVMGNVIPILNENDNANNEMVSLHVSYHGDDFYGRN